MANVLILHGKPDKWQFYDKTVPLPGEDHWHSWLAKQLLMQDIEVAKPSVYRAFEASYEIWCKEVERFDINEETVCVGHSCGGGFFLRWLSENKNKKIKKLILVAPWLDPLEFMIENFGVELFNFEADKDLFDRIEEHIVFHSDNDMDSIQLSLERIKEIWPEIKIRTFHNYGHFCKEDLGGEAFPELLEEVHK